MNLVGRNGKTNNQENEKKKYGFNKALILFYIM